MENVATPDEFRLLLPSRVVPVKKLIVPRGEPLGMGVTLAVSETNWSTVAGFGDAASVVVVFVRAVIVSGTTFEVDVAKTTFPE